MNIDKIRKDYKTYTSNLDKNTFSFHALHNSGSFKPFSHTYNINMLLNKTKETQYNSFHRHNNKKIFKDFNIHYTKNGNNKYSNLIKNTNNFLNNINKKYQTRSQKTTIINNFNGFDKSASNGGASFLNKNKNNKNPLTLKESSIQNYNHNTSNSNGNNENFFSNYIINKKILKKLYPNISKRIDILKNVKNNLNKSRSKLKSNFSRTYSSSSYCSFYDKNRDNNNDNIVKTERNYIYYINQSENRKHNNLLNKPELFKSLPKPKLAVPKFSEFYSK